MNLDDFRRKLLPHKRGVFITLAAFIVLFFVFQCSRAAEGAYTRLDAGYRIAKGEAPALVFSAVYPGPAENLSWQGGLGLLGSATDPDYGYTRNNAFLYAMLVTERGRVGLGLGTAHLFERSPYSGSQTQFALLLRVRLFTLGRGRCDATHFHLSNAGISLPNPGFEIPAVGCSLQW